MSYAALHQLINDSDFAGRSQACALEQAEVFKDDQRPEYVSVALAVARGELEQLAAFTRLNAAGPGMADKVDNGDGTIDQAKVTDADLLSLTQANWPVVASLYYDTEGVPLR